MRQQPSNRVMAKAFTLVVLATMVGSCIARGRAWKEPVQWPDHYSDKNVVPFMEAGAALAAAAAVREMVRTNPFPRLFAGCSSPEQGLDVAVYRGPTAGLFYVLVDQRFDRCGGPRVRVLDGWYEYAVTPQGEIVAEGPPSAGEETSLPPDDHPPAPSEPPPVTPSPPVPSVDAGPVTPSSDAEHSLH
jgi:hypothetical protein